MSDKPLHGRTAIITGATSGLGRRFADVLSDRGCAVALMGRRTDRLESAVAQIIARGGKATAISLDVADAAAIAPTFDQAQASLGPLDILINNAGVGGEGMALDLSIEAFDQTFDVNVRGVFFAAQAAARLMIDNGSAGRGTARIVNIASIVGYTPVQGLSAYAASKAGVLMMTKVMAREWARHGVAVNAICPGYIETEINAGWFATEGGQRQIKGFPRRRLIDEDALDETLLMLCGPAARFITGTAITVDDGQSL